MHRLIKDGISKEEIDFPWDIEEAAYCMNKSIDNVNALIELYKNTEDKDKKEQLFLAIKGLVPEGYMQTRMVSLNYQTLKTMYNQRKNHRLSH